MLYVLMLCLFGNTTVAARPIAIQGQVYPIVEQDPVRWIEEELQKMEKSGKIAELQKNMQERTQKALEYPTPVHGVSKALTARSYDFDPSIVNQENIYNHKKQLINKKGIRINPLEYVELSRPLLFIDAEDAKQVAWALAEEMKFGVATLILIRGPVVALRRTLKREVYFDQQGKMVRRLGITQVPAKVTQKDRLLHIEEIPVGS